MEKDKPKFCPAIWFSGFFALGAIMHLIRLLLGFSVVIAGREIPLTVSAAMVVIFGILSIGLAMMGLKKPCEDKNGPNPCCKH